MAPSIFDLVGQSDQKRARPAPKKKRKPKGLGRGSPAPEGGSKKKSAWGTPQEKYRRVCMLAQLLRHAYYVHATSIVDDQFYDRLERVILRIEEGNRDIIDRWSPTSGPGSDNRDSYPQSALFVWAQYKDRPEMFRHIASVIDGAIRDAAVAYGVSPD